MWKFREDKVITRDDIYKVGYDNDDLAALWSGEVRCPQAGEYYLTIDNGVVKAYEAYNDKVSAYHIAIVYKTEKVVSYRLKERLI